MSLEVIKRTAYQLQKLNKKIDILKTTIIDSYKIGESSLDKEISEDNIHSEYRNWRLGLFTKYYNPRR